MHHYPFPPSLLTIYNMVIILIFLMLCVLPNTSTGFVLVHASNSKCPSVLTAANIEGVNIEGVRDVRGGGDDAVIKVLIPWKVGFDDFVKFNSDTCMLDGFSIQVFWNVLQNMKSHAPSIHIILDGDGKTTPSYDEMVEKVSNGSVDMIVADLTITKKRMEKVAFTLPYLRARVVMVTLSSFSRDGREGKPWDFLLPFSTQLWVMLLVFFAATGMVLFVLENNNPDFNMNMVLNKCKNDLVAGGQSTNNMHDDDQQVTPTTHPSQELDRASLKRCFMNAYWFTSLCVFGAQKESVRTYLGRIVTVSWLLVMFIVFNASYTASLTSLLSLQTRNPIMQGVQALLKNESITVGYQEGSSTQNLLQNLIGIHGSRVKAYNSTPEFIKGLEKGSDHGGVDAIIDELPIVQPLLKYCRFIRNSNDGQLPSSGGYGFAFAKNSTLTNKVSKEILALIENKTIKQLQNTWKTGNGESVDDKDCSFSQLVLRNFTGLFGILGGVYLICIIVRFSTYIKRWKFPG